MVYQKLGSAIPYPVFWVAVPVVTVASLALVYRALMRCCPRLFAPLIGAEPPGARRAAPALGAAARVSS